MSRQARKWTEKKFLKGYRSRPSAARSLSVVGVGMALDRHSSLTQFTHTRCFSLLALRSNISKQSALTNQATAEQCEPVGVASDGVEIQARLAAIVAHQLAYKPTRNTTSERAAKI